MFAAVIGCGHPMLIAAGFADAIVGRPDYMAGQTDTAWDTAFSCALLLYVLVLLVIAGLKLRDDKQLGLLLQCVAAFYATMGYWVCGISVS
jgi:hypothetical protein